MNTIICILLAFTVSEASRAVNFHQPLEYLTLARLLKLQDELARQKQMMLDFRGIVEPSLQEEINIVEDLIQKRQQYPVAFDFSLIDITKYVLHPSTGEYKALFSTNKEMNNILKGNKNLENEYKIMKAEHKIHTKVCEQLLKNVILLWKIPHRVRRLRHRNIHNLRELEEEFGDRIEELIDLFE